jgi:general secretion pathway protein D
MATELDKLFGAASELPLAGLFRFVPIERLNAILVITPQAEFLNDVSAWIERLDGSGGERLYVYEVQYSDSEYLASLINQIYEDSVSSSAASTSSGQVAPNRTPSQIGTSSANGRDNQENGTANAIFQLSEAEQTAGMPPPIDLGGNNLGSSDFGGSSSGSFGGGGLGGITDTVRVIADTENNSLLIWASSQNYDKLLSALRKVDVPKRQVLIEATIAEVTLTDELRYGLRWFFENDIGSNYTGAGALNLGDGPTLSTEGILGSGFSYAILNSGGMVRAVLNLLAQDNKLRVLSSPQLMVIDNQEAKINVGREIPVATSSTVVGDNLSSNFQFRDTGVILEVKPQINAGGLVTLDVSQEVSSALDGETRNFNGNPQPVISQRTINSKVAVQSGQTLVLGGLITESSTNNKDGIPGLYKLPIIGPLFGNTSQTSERTELVVLLTPRVVNNSIEADEITTELKERMRGIIPLDSPWKRKPLSSLPKKANK